MKIFNTIATVIGLALAAGLIVGIMAITKTGFVIIDGWEVGVKKSGTEYDMIEEKPGYKWFMPIYTTIEPTNGRPVMFNYTKSELHETSTDEIRYKKMITGVDKNGIPISFAIAIEITPIKDMMAEMYQSTGSYENALKKKAIEPNKSIIKDVMGQFDAKTIQSKRNEVSKMLNDKFTKFYKENIYFNLDSPVDLKEIELPKSIQEGQIQVQLQAQLAEKSEELILMKENEAKAEVKRAEGIATAKVVEAQGKADSVLIEAKAQAQANKLLADSLTDKVIKIQTIEKWNGVTPYLVGSESSQFIMDIKSK